MSVRKRTWTTRQGERKDSWVVDYVDQGGKRHLKTFERKKDADAYAATTHVAVRQGTHVPDSATVTVKEAGEMWIKTGQAAGLERTTIDYYQGHLTHHINPFLGAVKLSKLNGPTVRAFQERLRAEGRSAVMVRRAVASLGALLGDAFERGLISTNPVRNMRIHRKRGREDGQVERRHKGKLKVGIHIPTPDEVNAIMKHLRGHWRPLLLTAIFSGLRASELRGLRWSDLTLKGPQPRLQVRQRADRFNAIGPPKSATSERDVPLLPMVTNILKEWRLACPNGDLDLVFPNGAGRIENVSNIIHRGLKPAQVAAGVVKEDGTAKYTGMHALRHFYASWCFANGLSPKVVQERLGHASIALTLDRYTHLIPQQNDDHELAAAERALFA